MGKIVVFDLLTGVGKVKKTVQDQKTTINTQRTKLETPRNTTI